MAEIAFALHDSIPSLAMASAVPVPEAQTRDLNDSLPWLAMEFSSPVTAASWRALNGISPVTLSLPFYPGTDPTSDEIFTLVDIVPFGVSVMVVRNEPLYVAQRLAAIEDRITRTTGQSRTF